MTDTLRTCEECDEELDESYHCDFCEECLPSIYCRECGEECEADHRNICEDCENENDDHTVLGKFNAS